MKTIQSIFFFLIVNIGFSQNNFEGLISFAIDNGNELIYRNVYLKGDSARVEEWNKVNPYKKSIILMDFKSSKSFIISKERKIYMPISRIEKTETTYQFNIAKQIEIDSAFHSAVNQWKVIEENLNRTVTYDLAVNNFNFYHQMLQLLPNLNFIEKLYLQLPIAENVMPIQANYYTLNRELQTNYKVIAIEPQLINSVKFKLPKDYQAF